MSSSFSPPCEMMNFGVGGKLAELDRYLVVEHVLLEPQLVQACGRRGFEAANRHQAADVVGGDALTMNLKTVGVKTETVPQAELPGLQVSDA